MHFPSQLVFKSYFLPIKEFVKFVECKHHQINLCGLVWPLISPTGREGATKCKVDNWASLWKVLVIHTEWSFRNLDKFADMNDDENQMLFLVYSFPKKNYLGFIRLQKYATSMILQFFPTLLAEIIHSCERISLWRPTDIHNNMLYTSMVKTADGSVSLCRALIRFYWDYYRQIVLNCKSKVKLS